MPRPKKVTPPPLMDQIARLELLSKDWKSLYLLLLERIGRRDPEFAEALMRQAVKLARELSKMGLPIPVPSVGGPWRFPYLDDPETKIRELFAEARLARLQRKREFKDSIEYLSVQYNVLYEKLSRLERAKWPAFTQAYWRLLDRQGTIPPDIKQQLQANLKGIRGIKTAALQILTDVLRRADRESLRVQLSRRRR